MSDTVDKATQTLIQNLEAKTGKTVPQWIKIARAGGAKHGEIVKFLKAEHGLTHGYANFIALRALESASPQPAGADPIDAQYAGAKAELRPIYDKIIQVVKKFGDDVELAPKKAYVSLRRKKQFGCVQPVSATRVDVGLNLKGVKPGGRLETSGSNGMFTHRVKVTRVAEVDKELIAWLRRAYDEA